MNALDHLPIWADALIAAMLLVSAFTALVGSLALVKFSDFYKRLHGPPKSTTLGVGGVLIASFVFFTVRGPGFSVHEFLITVFLFLTAPVSAHLLVKAAMHLTTPNVQAKRRAAPTLAK
jgi:multicomponent K+:H+ antiporter subunit G